MFVRRKENRSGSTSVVVVDKSSGAFTELKVIGVGMSEEEISAFVKEGKEWIAHYAGQQTISFPDETAEQLKREEDAMTEHIVFVTALTLLVLLVPGMQSLFKLAPMTSGQWWTVIGLSFGVLALSELFKLFTRNKGR